MTDGKDKTAWFERKGSLTWIHRGLWGVCAALALADFILHKHATFRIEEFPAFYGIYGFLACIALVLGARVMRKALKRSEDYYDR